MMMLKSQIASRPAVRPAASSRRVVAVRASGPQVDLTKKVADAVKEAEEACAKGTTAVRGSSERPSSAPIPAEPLYLGHLSPPKAAAKPAEQPDRGRGPRALLESQPASTERSACSPVARPQDCAVAWDTVEELSAAASHKKDAVKADVTLSDPLEKFCQDAPDADECR
jgi:hypothetical protein